jgi:hypothetical protein
MARYWEENLGNQDRRWWKKTDEQDIAETISAEVERIDNDTIDRQQYILEAMALYGDIGAWPGSAGISRVLPSTRRISHNVIATAVDALVAEVTQSVPRPMAVTIGGTYQQQRKARMLTRYWEAKFDQTDTHMLGRQAVRDCIQGGLGILRPYRVNPSDPENDEVAVERIFPGHFLIDDRSAIDVLPRQCYIRRFIDKSLLIELWPDKETEIESSKAPDQRYWFSHDNRNDMAEVIESYHLASKPGGTDGMHAMVVGDVLLVKEEYTRMRFPLAFVRPVAPQRGFWGESLVRRAAPAQFELNKLLRRVQESMHLHAVPRVFVSRQSGIVEGHMQNDVGIMVEYDGQPPVFMNPQSMGSDVYQHLRTLEEWVYKEMGVSELSATSRKPPGLDSGAALRTYNDVQSRRWINLQRSYERMSEDVAREMALLEMDIAKDCPGHTVGATSGKRVDELKWKDIELDENRFHVRVFSSSALPNTPAGKLQALEEMVKAGVIDQKTFIRLADVPDLESVRDLEVAPEELLTDMFENFLDGKAYILPEPHQDLARGRTMATLMWQRATLDGATPKDTDMLTRWIKDSLDLETRIQQMAMAEEQERAGVLQAQQMEQMQQAAAMAPQPGQAPPGPLPGGAQNLQTPTQGSVPTPNSMPEGMTR